MDFYGASDLDVMFAEFGVPVTLTTAAGVLFSTRGIVDTTEDDLLNGPAATIAGRVMTVLVKTDSLGVTLKEGATVTVDAVAYRVVTARVHDDGALTRVHLARKT